MLGILHLSLSLLKLRLVIKFAVLGYKLSVILTITGIKILMDTRLVDAVDSMQCDTEAGISFKLIISLITYVFVTLCENFGSYTEFD